MVGMEFRFNKGLVRHNLIRKCADFQKCRVSTVSQAILTVFQLLQFNQLQFEGGVGSINLKPNKDLELILLITLPIITKLKTISD